MVLPNYKKSLVNLMSSIASGFGVRLKYKPLKILERRKLKEAKNIILLVIDGLGAEFVKKNMDKKSIFVKNKIGEIKAVFPSTTTSGIATFLTGEAPQEHGLISWNMNLKELGGIVKVLPWESRGGGKIKVKINKFLKQEPFIKKIKAACYCIAPPEIIKSEFNNHFNKKAKPLGYNSLQGMFYQLNKTIKKHQQRKFIYAYWPGFDGLAHDYGMESRKLKSHFKELEKELESFAKRIKGTNTTLIVTSDHGMIDCQGINLNNHKKFYECLSCALCGEARAAFCYVKPDKVKQFKSYTRKNLSKYCQLFESKKLVEKGWFGSSKAHQKLLDRIGDYCLIAKKNYLLKDFLSGEKAKFMKATHGGLSKEEIYVPLVLIEG